MKRVNQALDWLFAPQWAGGWIAVRYLWALAAFLQYGSDVFSIGDVWGAPDMVFASGPYRLSEYFFMTPMAAYYLWGLQMFGISMVLWGGKALRPGLVLWAFGAWTMLGYEALNVKAHDRLLAWVSLVLFVSPAHERNLHLKYRSPFARYFLLVVMSAIYGATGWNKWLHEPTWFTDGSVLGLHFLHYHHGSRPLGVWLSSQTWSHLPMTAITVLWEAFFPILILIRRINPIMLVLGFLFHGVLLITMNVGPFAFVSWSTYPILLHPDLAEKAYRFLRGRFGSAEVTGEPAESP